MHVLLKWRVQEMLMGRFPLPVLPGSPYPCPLNPVTGSAGASSPADKRILLRSVVKLKHFMAKNLLYFKRPICEILSFNVRRSGLAPEKTVS